MREVAGDIMRDGGLALIIFEFTVGFARGSPQPVAVTGTPRGVAFSPGACVSLLPRRGRRRCLRSPQMLECADASRRRDVADAAGAAIAGAAHFSCFIFRHADGHAHEVGAAMTRCRVGAIIFGLLSN